MTSSSDSPPDIPALRQRFAQLERPARPRSTRDVILHELMPEIEKKLSRGWRYADVAAGLREVGISVSASTLRNYVAKARQDRGKSAASVPAKPTKNQPAVSQRAVTASSSVTESPAAQHSAETPPTPAARARRRAKKTIFAGFDETP